MTTHDDHSVEEIDETPEADHSQETPDQVQEETDEAKIEKKRYKEQLEGKQKQLLDAQVKLASLDATNLLELAKKDLKLANEVAKHFNYDSFDDAKAVISAGSQVERKTTDDTEDRETWYQRKRAQEEHDKSLKKVERIFEKLPEEEQEKAQRFFEKASKGKLLDEEEALEFAEAATLFARKDKLKGEKRDEGISNFGSTSLSSSRKPETSTKPKFEIVNGKVVPLSDKS